MTATVHTVDVAAGFQPNPVLVKGEGPPLVYLHGLLGQAWDGLLDGLSATRRVYAPAHAGADEPDELRGISGMHDLVLYYDDVLDALGLDRIDLVGHSFGGMVAAEIAAARPDRVRRLVLIDALGLWRDDAPVADFLLVPADRQAALLLGDPATDAVRAHLALPDDPEHRITETLRRTTSMASIAHFLWPIPERGLSRRLRRIKAPTLIVWGAEDRLVPSVYAQDFAGAIASARVEMIAGAGHTPHFPDCRTVLDKLTDFLA